MALPESADQPPREPADALVRAAASEPPTVVEAALGRVPAPERTAAAQRAAAAALTAARWATLAYLADFLADVTTARPPTGGDSGEDDGFFGGEHDDLAGIGGVDIASFVVSKR